MLKTSVYLPEALKSSLSRLAASSGQSEAELIREAIEARLQPGPEAPPLPLPARPGHLVGIGVGPGHADLLTIRALHALRRANRVIAPCTSVAAIGRAEAIVREAAGDILVERMVFVMATDHAARSEALETVCDKVASYLDAGDEVAFITLGDPNTYSTVSSVLSGVKLRRPQTTTETVAGIMAFQALAMAGDVVLTDEQQSLVLLPASAPPDVLKAELAIQTRTVVLYKGGGRIDTVADHLEAAGRLDSAVLGELLGMQGERVVPLAEVRDRPASYLSAVISAAPEGIGPTPPLSAKTTPLPAATAKPTQTASTKTLGNTNQ